MYNIPQTCDRQFIAQKVAKVQVSEFKPKDIFTADNDSNQCRVDDQQRMNVQEKNNSSIEQLLNRLPKLDEIVDITIQPHELKTDDDTNFHMDYIVATTLLRTENYEIQITDRSQIKSVAGNIIPAIVTTTAMVTGLVCLEVYKLIQDHKKIESYRNACLNLALPFFAFFEPVPSKCQKYLDKKFTLWDRFEVKGDMTLEEFIEYFKCEHKLVPNIISEGSFMIYCAHFMDQTNKIQNMKQKISHIYETVSKRRIPPHVRYLMLDMFCDDLEENEVQDVPYVKYTFA
ncbi:unnamed protein product [Rotaria sordida]|uniref:Ubiquitin-activating enzyme E1 C-terminal domain-containing protein n=1 Tax=Rotaria sordida TaxID=392033 RepID=A0A815FMV1_9BILA|nr:unnamed protein product [Rotaria sordida]